MNIKWYQWYIEVIKKYTTFTGRASRSEFWYFALVSILIAIPIFVLDIILDTFALILLYDIFVILPSIAVTVRRLHDVGKSGWWILIDLIPFIGFIVLLVFEIADSQPGANRFGENPKGINGVIVNNDTIKDNTTANPEVLKESANSTIVDVQNYKFCPKCGYRNDVSDNFCKQCGEKLS